jgi:rubrerythrin
MAKNDGLAFAHEFEVKGVNLYLKLAGKTRNLLAKELFYSLATQEVDHARRIDEIGVALRQKGAWPKQPAARAKGIEAEIKSFFTMANATQLRKDGENLAGYELALSMERKGFRAYRDYAATAASAGEREFFTRLTEEENQHYEALANVYSYLTKNDDWLQAEESRTWNWMNQ